MKLFYASPREIEMAEALEQGSPFEWADLDEEADCTCGGWGILRGMHQKREEAIANGHHYLYLDHAYIGRHEHFRATWNEHHYLGLGSPDHHLRPEPWRQTGTHILITTQSPAWYAMHGSTEREWVLNKVKRIGEYSDRPIKVRPKNAPYPIAEDLKDCWALVTFESNTVVDAILAGVPAFCDGGAGLMVASSNISHIELPFYPGDEHIMKWLGGLLENQWTRKQMASGEAWEKLSSRLNTLN